MTSESARTQIDGSDEPRSGSLGSTIKSNSEAEARSEEANIGRDEQKEQSADEVQDEWEPPGFEAQTEFRSRERRTKSRKVPDLYYRRKFVEDGLVSTHLEAGRVDTRGTRVWVVSSLRTVSGPIFLSRARWRRGRSMPLVLTFESGSNLERIEKATFRVSRLRSIVIPSSVLVLSESSFLRCQSLEAVIFESGSKLERIETSAFVESGLKSIEIPSSVIVLNESSFEGCAFLESVTFESGSRLERIGKSAYARSGLKSIDIPSSVIVLNESSFALCKSLESVIFESGSRLERIENSAFY
jgi:hypothetical protein